MGELRFAEKFGDPSVTATCTSRIGQRGTVAMRVEPLAGHAEPKTNKMLHGA